jgi:hypothetical protein
MMKMVYNIAYMMNQVDNSVNKTQYKEKTYVFCKS